MFKLNFTKLSFGPSRATSSNNANFVKIQIGNFIEDQVFEAQTKRNKAHALCSKVIW